MAARPKPARGQLRSRSELIAAARRRGRSGRPAQDWIRADPAHLAAYDQGRAEFADKQDRTDLRTGQETPPAAAPGPAAGGPDRLDQAANKARSSTGKFFTAGDGGGLLLAFVAYPLVLSVIKYGAAGPMLWFRAKWLNETTKNPNNLGPVTPTRPDPYANVPGMPGYHSPQLPGGTFPSPNDPGSNNGGWGPRPPGWQGSWPPGGGGSGGSYGTPA